MTTSFGPRLRATSSLRSSRGFSLLELMVVLMVVGAILLLVPMNMEGFGSRSRLESSANSIVSAIAGGREQAIIDGYDVYLELGWYRDLKGGKRQGYRFKFTDQPKETSQGEDGALENTRYRSREREWVYTDWHELQSGVDFAGVSERAGSWQQLSAGGKPYPIRFGADGNIGRGVAIRLESQDLEVKKEFKIITIVVNPLTSEPSWMDGEHELRKARPASDFGN